MSRSRNNLPQATDAEGHVIEHAGKYAKASVLTAFEMIGGTQRMAEWANENPTDFFTKLFPKVIEREATTQRETSVEELLEDLDREMIDVTPDEDSPWPGADEADFEDLDDDPA